MPTEPFSVAPAKLRSVLHARLRRALLPWAWHSDVMRDPLGGRGDILRIAGLAVAAASWANPWPVTRDGVEALLRARMGGEGPVAWRR